MGLTRYLMRQFVGENKHFCMFRSNKVKLLHNNNDVILRDVQLFFNSINYVVTYLMALQETKQYFT